MSVANNPNILWEHVVKYSLNIITFCLENPNAMKGIEDYEHLVDYDWLSCNPALTEDYILAHLDKPWRYGGLLYSNKLTWKSVKIIGIEKFPHAFEFLDNIPLDIFKERINSITYSGSVSTKISWEVFNEYTNLPWDYDKLSTNLNIPIEYIFNNPDKQWNYNRVSNRKDLTWRHVVNHPEIPWNFREFSCNGFRKEWHWYD